MQLADLVANYKEIKNYSHFICQPLAKVTQFGTSGPFTDDRNGLRHLASTFMISL